MRLFEVAVTEAPGRTAVFTFGRMNPPTIGHEVLVNRVVEVADKLGADHYIYLSHSQKPPKDPLAAKDKLAVANAAFPGANILLDPEVKNPFTALGKLEKEYDTIVLVVGGDRVPDFKKMADFKKKEGKIDFKIVSAGERDPDAEGIGGMSASKARALAVEGNWDAFDTSLPETVPTAQKKKVYNQIRKNS